MAKVQIQPKILKGFRDLLPRATIVRGKMIHSIQGVFETFGFVPIDTPALEYSEILLGKGSEETDKQMYRFLDNGERDIALRFDLTVPLARYVATHINELGTPFRRYHIAPVWRAEKPQRGRYREFIQCDFDIIGTSSLLADAEIVSVIHETLKALEIHHTVRINNRKLLNGLLESLGAKEKTTQILRAIDKLDKLGRETVEKELAEEAGLSASQTEEVFSLILLGKNNESNEEILTELRPLADKNELAARGLEELNFVASVVSSIGIPTTQFLIDPSIARGLDYYTGTVFETVLTDLPEVGSICSGGRYDNLASLYSKKELPGVGASIGLDRILGALEELERIPEKTSTAQLLVTLLDEGTEAKMAAIAQQIRKEGYAVEIYPEKVKLGTQLKYANRRGIEGVVIAGEKELANNVVNVKDLRNGEQKENISLGDLKTTLKELAF